jgi:alginate O-acetyltransferase complex protein AlgI
MLFNSFHFLIFFPVVTLIYFILPHRFRWIHLLAASCIFYCFFIPKYLSILALTIVVDYVAALYIQKTEGIVKKAWLIVSIVSTCLILIIFKYFNFFNESFANAAALMGLHYPVKALNIILPIGLSFHTFQSLSYVIEVYRGNQKPEKHFGIYSLYVMFYPQLVAGPIERPQNILHQFYEKHNFNYDDAVIGLRKIMWGLFKKVVVADRLSVYVNTVYNNHDHHNGNSLFVATIFFAFQIYCDFSGYSDIAIGTARVMGFRLMTNFNRPYFSRSISEFWKRWHISLSTWFKDYVYIPLGGNRVSRGRMFFNLFITFTLSGLWHGSNWTYIIWGALNGFYLIFGFITNNASESFKATLIHRGFYYLVSAYNIFATFLLIALSWIFFRANTLSGAFSIIRKIFTERGAVFTWQNREFLYGAFFLVVLLVVEIFEEYKLMNSFSLFHHQNFLIRRASYILVILLILMFGVFGTSQFIYFQF